MDHGGDIDRAMANFGGQGAAWIDLSTGINRSPYPVHEVSGSAWQGLPTRADMASLRRAAARYYGAKGGIAVLAGAQSVIQGLPLMAARGLVRILAPTYNEYAAVFSRAGWCVEQVTKLDDLAGADVAIVVNPNNPNGRLQVPEELLRLKPSVGLLVVDESFMDMTPQHSLSAMPPQDGLLILRSFGKFFGLAGLRLGFALGTEALCGRIAEQVGPWPVSGPAIEIAIRAFEDHQWIAATRADLADCALRCDAIVPWPLVGGTDLFRLYDVGAAIQVQKALASQAIWTRVFPWSDGYLRMGTPARHELPRLEAAIRVIR